MSAAEVLEGMPIALREAKPEDIGFIVDTWRRSYSTESEIFAWDKDVFFRVMAKHINGILKDSTTRALLAVDAGDPDTIVGWAVISGKRLHYVYVRGGDKSSMRRMGIARMLLDQFEITTYSTKTQAFASRLMPDRWGGEFAPVIHPWARGKVRVEIS